MKKGFTLAEVLITIGMIGVVAAITMPVLIASYREKEIVTRLKKAYSNITQAYALALVENGAPNYWSLGEEGNSEGAKTIQKYISPYYSVWKDCQTDGGCWPDNNIIYLNNSSSSINPGTNASYSTFQIVDGTLFAFKVLSNACDTAYGTGRALENICAEVFIDINGERHPNQFGYDVYKFYITKTGLFPAGLENEQQFAFDTNCLNKTSGLGCTAWVVTRSNMDYLHCNDIGWDAKSSCKNIFNYNHSSGL